jgi:hypothetical protein
MSRHVDARRPDNRGQSSVVGVALLLGATVIALGVLTASVGALVGGHVAHVDAGRVASDLDAALDPAGTTGHDSDTISFTDGTLGTVERDLRVLRSGSVVKRVRVDALVFEHGERRVAAVAGAVVRGRGEAAWLVSDPPIVADGDGDLLVVGAAKFGSSTTSLGGSQVTATLATNVTHDRQSLPDGRYAVAIETATPEAFEAYFTSAGASVSRTDFDGDGVVSVVATYPGRRTAYLVTHRLRLEVRHG